MAAAARGRRKSVRKFKTPVQGPRAYVEFHKPTWGQIREVVADVRQKASKYLSAGAQAERLAALADDKEAAEVEDKLTTTLWDLARNDFVSWNWVDDEGELLPPLPEIEPEDLYGDEVRAIFDLVQKMYMLEDIDEDEEGN